MSLASTSSGTLVYFRCATPIPFDAGAPTSCSCRWARRRPRCHREFQHESISSFAPLCNVWFFLLLLFVLLRNIVVATGRVLICCLLRGVPLYGSPCVP